MLCHISLYKNFVPVSLPNVENPFSDKESIPTTTAKENKAKSYLYEPTAWQLQPELWRSFCCNSSLQIQT